jgi:DNA polymerase III subunit gamma/tau
MSTVVLNLSRKWRSQDFDQLVGQDLAVRILKNSLYLGHYFPVYLFAGQRGCGKTSTARIFAAAVNCAALPLFQKDPKKSSIPCLVCDSCIAMRDGNHPDFVEIDAASHTGVDNIRSIIESSSLLPLIGQKRVYLIDEAHMLSKAAFNAALKILEEPPATALFILATTNHHKIIDTVRSRCFQLFFTPIPHNPLKNHLQIICKKEKIAYADEALDLIVRHAEGSARDALNLLEQVRFSSSTVSKESVLSLLGHIGDQQIFDLIRLVIQGNATDLVQLLHSLQIDQHKAEFIWQRMVVLLRALIWLKHGVNPQEIITTVAMLQSSAQWCSLADLHRIVETLYAHEELFFKTAMQHIFLEMILLGLCCKDKKRTDDGSGSAPCALGAVSIAGDSSDVDSADEDSDEVISHDEQWLRFVAHIETLNDSLLCSVFKQARFIAYDMHAQRVSIELSKDFILFKEWLDNSKGIWQPLLRSAFSQDTTLDAQFTGINKVERDKKQKSDNVADQTMPKRVVSAAPSQAVHHKEKTSQSRPQEQFHGARYNNNKKVVVGSHKNEARIDVSDESVWKKAAMLQRHFPGVITEIRENR